MLRVHVGLFMIATRDLSGLVGQMIVDVVDRGDTPISPVYRRDAVRVVKQLGDTAEEIPLQRHLVTKIRRLESRLETQDSLTTRTAAELMKQLQEDVILEQTSHLFLMVREERGELYLQKHPPFGEAVAAAFPEAHTDVSEGTRCLALEQWTAAVFHLMRAAEWALRRLATDMGVQNVEMKDFGQLVQETRARHDLLSSRDPKKQFSADALASLELFKDAWRNPVVHGRDHYDERRAFDVWNGVRAFMQSLARGSR